MKARWIVPLLGALAVLGGSATLALGEVKALPNDPMTGFPFAYHDDVNGFSVGLCMDGAAGNCIGAPVPKPEDPYMVPDNFTPDGEAFWWRADAAFPPPFDKALVEFAQEAAFATPDIEAGQQIAFSRIRFARFPISGPDSLKPNTWYRFSHPYGVDEVQTTALGEVRFSEDTGCVTPPCSFAGASQGRLTALLFWDSAQPTPPAGFIGDPLVDHTVIGSPIGRDSVTVEELSGKGGSVVRLITQTDRFFVMGKLSGPAPTPAPFATTSTTELAFGATELDDVAPPQTFRLKNGGSAPMQLVGASVGGTDAADFSADLSACPPSLAPGVACEVVVRFQPNGTGGRVATLSIAHSARNTPKALTLTGTGAPAHRLRLLSARFAKGYGRNAKGGLSVGKFKANGLNLVLGLEPRTPFVRLRLLRVVPPVKTGGVRRLKVVLTEVVAPTPGANGMHRVWYTSPTLLAAARRGDFRLQITPFRRLPRLGHATVIDFTLDHR